MEKIKVKVVDENGNIVDVCIFDTIKQASLYASAINACEDPFWNGSKVYAIVVKG